MGNRKNLRRVSMAVSAQTLWHLRELAKASKYGGNLGKAVDKLVREKMLGLRGLRDG